MRQPAKLWQVICPFTKYHVATRGDLHHMWQYTCQIMPQNSKCVPAHILSHTQSCVSMNSHSAVKSTAWLSWEHTPWCYIVLHYTSTHASLGVPQLAAHGVNAIVRLEHHPALRLEIALGSATHQVSRTAITVCNSAVSPTDHQ